MRDDFNISLQLLTEDGRNLRQVDHHLDGGLIPWGVVELSTADLPEGKYQAMLILYHRDGGAKVSGIDTTSDIEFSFLPLLDIELPQP